MKASIQLLFTLFCIFTVTPKPSYAMLCDTSDEQKPKLSTQDLNYTKKINTFLLQAARHNMPNLLQEVLDCGANINTRGRRGFTPLIYAARKNHAPIVKLLLDNKAHVDTQCSEYMTALHHAINSAYDNPEIISLLVSHNADIELPMGPFQRGETSLIRAIQKNKIKTVVALLYANADRTVGSTSPFSDFYQKTAFDAASSQFMRTILEEIPYKKKCALRELITLKEIQEHYLMFYPQVPLSLINIIIDYALPYENEPHYEPFNVLIAREWKTFVSNQLL